MRTKRGRHPKRPLNGHAREPQPHFVSPIDVHSVMHALQCSLLDVLYRCCVVGTIFLVLVQVLWHS